MRDGVIFTAHHGKLSSASTGKLAVLLFPLVAADEKTISMAGAGASTSMSSPNSDMMQVVRGGSMDFVGSFL